MKPKSFIYILSLSALLFSCSDDDKGSPGVKPAWNPGKVEVSDAERGMVSANNGFAFSILKELTAGGAGKSVMVSPASLTYGMSMVAAGAESPTRSEIYDMLGFSGSASSDVNNLCKTLISGRTALDPQTQIHIASAFVADKKSVINPEYLSLLGDFYGAEGRTVDSDDEAAALKSINDWCADHTDGMIPKLISSLGPNFRSIALNAVSFKGLWYKKFDKSDTKDGNFLKSDGTYAVLPMMRQEESFSYYDAGDFRMVSLPYGNGSFSMVVLLPGDGKELSDVISGLDRQSWETAFGRLGLCPVDLKLPRFTVEFNRDMSDHLKSLGASTVFTPDAGLSLISDEDIFVTQVVHAAKIVVDEDGTKASSSTGVSQGTLSPGSAAEFHADRPFVYAIVENSTGQIYFIGTFTGV